MSSRTPRECVDLAVDESATDAERDDAIHALRMANECDELGKLARMDDLADRYRRLALQELATPQCDATLRNLADDDSLSQSLRDEATELLRELDDD